MMKSYMQVSHSFVTDTVYLRASLELGLLLHQRRHHPHHLPLVLRMLLQPIHTMGVSERFQSRDKDGFVPEHSTHFANIDVSLHRSGGSRFSIDQ